MAYDNYWSRKADPAAVAQRRCVWVTGKANGRGSSCEANPASSSGGHGKLGYEAGAERSTVAQEKNREEERIWLEWQSADFDAEHCQSHVEVSANNSVLIESLAPSAPRKQSLTINTDGIVEDVALNSAGQELNWDPFLPYGYPLSPNGCAGTGSSTWEKSLPDQTPEGGNEQGDEQWEESVGVLEHIIDPRLLANTAFGCGEA